MELVQAFASQSISPDRWFAALPRISNFVSSSIVWHLLLDQLLWYHRATLLVMEGIGEPDYEAIMLNQ
jgi:hypothetical protein